MLIPTALRGYSGGRVQVEVPGGGSLRQVIDNLEAECPGIKAQIIEDGDIRPGIAIAVDDELTSAGLLERVPDDGSVNILPAIGGGARLAASGSRSPLERLGDAPGFGPRY